MAHVLHPEELAPTIALAAISLYAAERRTPPRRGGGPSRSRLPILPPPAMVAINPPGLTSRSRAPPADRIEICISDDVPARAEWP